MIIADNSNQSKYIQIPINKYETMKADIETLIEEYDKMLLTLEKRKIENEQLTKEINRLKLIIDKLLEK